LGGRIATRSRVDFDLKRTMTKGLPFLKALAEVRRIGVHEGWCYIDGFRSSMRNLLDESSIAQSLDGGRLMGSLLFPRNGLLD
jgi:hypothetical protein